MALSVGKPIIVQSYKHDTTLHRIWSQATVLFDDDEVVIVANDRTKVVEANGRFWFTKEPSVTYFYKNRWYNVIGIIKAEGISYYCNLSSPALVDEEAIKYIDYDLDVKVSIDGTITVLDQNEYKKHAAEMGYPADLCAIIETEFRSLQAEVRRRAEPFSTEGIAAWYAKYQSIHEEN
ncbi:MAG: DUF402 domain-containing protein [Bacillota bacterium]|nr:DUF402 domain-containing protein [Bacillota bacterium]